MTYRTTFTRIFFTIGAAYTFWGIANWTAFTWVIFTFWTAFTLDRMACWANFASTWIKVTYLAAAARKIVTNLARGIIIAIIFIIFINFFMTKITMVMYTFFTRFWIIYNIATNIV